MAFIPTKHSKEKLNVLFSGPGILSVVTKSLEALKSHVGLTKYTPKHGHDVLLSEIRQSPTAWKKKSSIVI